jgi:hypothetical protein
VSQLINLELPGGLEPLVKYCETLCEAECCGVDAFDFSPVHIASYLCRYTGAISATDIVEIEGRISELEACALNLPSDERGFICTISVMNENFSRKTFTRFIAELRMAVQTASGCLRASVPNDHNLGLNERICRPPSHLPSVLCPRHAQEGIFLVTL